jgi:hypothetical protein
MTGGGDNIGEGVHWCKEVEGMRYVIELTGVHVFASAVNHAVFEYCRISTYGGPCPSTPPDHNGFYPKKEKA